MTTVIPSHSHSHPSHLSQVRVEGDSVVVKADKSSLTNFRRTMTMCPAAPQEDKRTFLLVGGGVCSEGRGMTCVLACVQCTEIFIQYSLRGRSYQLIIQ